MDKKPLRLGTAYHGNRMPHHAREDLLDFATHGLDLVVHTFSHTDWVGAQAADPDLNVYKFVLDGCRENLRVAEQFGKDHNVWLQAFGNPP